MKITFKINAELTINDLELGELECIHRHEHKDNNKEFNHYCADSNDNSLGSLKGSAALKFDAGLDFDATPEEMKASFEMIQALGSKFAEVTRRSKDLGERVVTKINQSASEEQPKDDSDVDLTDVHIRIKDALRRAERNIEENESGDAAFKIDLSDLRTASRLLKDASELAEEYDLAFKYDQKIYELKKRLSALNDKC